jgi:hypothetical protein
MVVIDLLYSIQNIINIGMLDVKNVANVVIDLKMPLEVCYISVL